MVAEVEQGRVTYDELHGMRSWKELSKIYPGKRTTLKAARQKALEQLRKARE
jgi:hypothetical protein